MFQPSSVVTKRAGYIAFALAVAFCLFMIAPDIRVTVDAYLSFRVVDNAVNGYGLRWNVQDRVQVYTNPLWTLIHIPFYALWRNIADVTIVLSAACMVATVWLLIKTFRLPVLTASLLVLAISLSPTFTSNAISGLENPLILLLFVSFGYVLLNVQSPLRWFWLTLLVALAGFNRLDTLIVYIPVMAWLALSQLRQVRWGQLIAGSLPLIGWLAFSLLYYGFLFPNTKYAKLHTSIPQEQYTKLGINYIVDFAWRDPIMALLIVVAAVTSVLMFIRHRDTKEKQLMLLALGMLAYCCYVVAVGGTFTACRLMSLPVIMGLWICLAHLPALNARMMMGIAALFLALASLSYMPPWQHTYNRLRFYPPGEKVPASRVKPYYFLIQDPSGTGLMISPYLNRRAMLCLPDMKFEVRSVLSGGIPGFFDGGPCRYILERTALGDSLLARLPVRTRYLKRMTELQRNVPAGYEHALLTGSLDQMHPSLAKYYEKLRLITTGDLWSKERLETILHFNLGEYNHWRDEYVQDMERERAAKKAEKGKAKQPPAQ